MDKGIEFLKKLRKHDATVVKKICKIHDSDCTHVLVTGIPNTRLLFPKVGIFPTYIETPVSAECVHSIHKHNPLIFVNSVMVKKSENVIDKHLEIKELNQEKAENPDPTLYYFWNDKNTEDQTF